MADVVITPANVTLVSGTALSATAAVAINQGEAIRIDNAGATSTKNDTAENAAASGIAVSKAGVGEQVLYAGRGAVVNIGGTVVAGRVYMVSAAAGGIMPESDLATGNFSTIIGTAVSTSNIRVDPNPSGVAIA